MIILFKDKEFWFEEKNFKKARITCFLQWLRLSQKNECEGMKGLVGVSGPRKHATLFFCPLENKAKEKQNEIKQK